MVVDLTEDEPEEVVEVTPPVVVVQAVDAFGAGLLQAVAESLGTRVGLLGQQTASKL